MSHAAEHPVHRHANPSLDLVLERVVPVPRELVWRAWTEPSLMTQWFTPAPWKTVDAELDLRPGGIFRTVMQSPEGQNIDSEGCILEVVDGERLVWTSALRPGYRARTRAEVDETPFFFTAVITLESVPEGTRYTARAIHADEDGATRHREMGFHAGWGAALDQLVALMSRS